MVVLLVVSIFVFIWHLFFIASSVISEQFQRGTIFNLSLGHSDNAFAKIRVRVSFEGNASVGDEKINIKLFFKLRWLMLSTAAAMFGSHE